MKDFFNMSVLLSWFWLMANEMIGTGFGLG
jgi:hypothetical protein